MVGRAPSPYWSEVARADRKAFPPRVDNPNCAMKRCRHGSYRCGRIYPRPYIADTIDRQENRHVICQDCINESILRAEQALRRREGEVDHDPRSRQNNEACDVAEASSPTTRAQHELQRRNERVPALRLASEREADLLREIERQAMGGQEFEIKAERGDGVGQSQRYLRAATEASLEGGAL